MTHANTEESKPQGAALYVHWPFCKKKCPYCDFNSHVREEVEQEAWSEALVREIRYWQERVPGRQISSIFFGGGTPSLMPPETVAAVIETAERGWGFADDIEITLEANPTSVEAEKFRAFHSAGVNRVSLGVQSLRVESLAFLGREHGAREALNAVELAAVIFPRYSFDLIYALPQQTAQQWETELREALRYARGHLSLYQLTIEENTAFYHAYHVRRAFALPREELAADLYQVTARVMEEAGMPAYEISNYAAPGQESWHNLAYWRGDCYFGVGPGAHGRVELLDGGTARLNMTLSHVVNPLGACAAARAGGATRLEQTLVEEEYEGSLPLQGRVGVGASDLGLCPEAPLLTSPRRGEGYSRVATRALKSPERWLDQVRQYGQGVEEETVLTLEERAEEKVLMGLRLVREGLRYDRLRVDEREYVAGLFADGRVARLAALGLLRETPDGLFATADGQLVLNSVIQELLG